jgi:hypothetical protein
VEALRAFNASAPVLKPRALGLAAGARAGLALREPTHRAAEAGPARRPPATPLLLPPGPRLAQGWRQRMGQVLQSWPLQRLLARSS